MAWFISSKSNLASQAIQPLVAQVTAAGQLTRKDHMQLTTTLLSDLQLTHGDRQQINHILDLLQLGRIKLVD